MLLHSTATDLDFYCYGSSSIDSTVTRIFISPSFFFHSSSCGLNLFNFNPSSFCAIIIVIIGIRPSYIDIYLLVKDFHFLFVFLNHIAPTCVPKLQIKFSEVRCERRGGQRGLRRISIETWLI